MPLLCAARFDAQAGERKRETRGAKQRNRRRTKRRSRRSRRRKSGWWRRKSARGRKRVQARAGAAREGGNKEEGRPASGRREKRVAKCRSSTPVRNKEQKIDRLLSFMFLRGRRRSSLVRPSVRFLSRPSSTTLSYPSSSSSSSFPPFCFVLLILRATAVFLSSFLFRATYNKTNRGNSARRAMGKEPGGHAEKRERGVEREREREKDR